MIGARVLDTETWIAFLRGDEAVTKKVDQTERLLLPFAVLGELLLGVERSRRPEVQRQRVEAIVAACEFVPPTPPVCRRYARIKSLLMSKGRPIPENDIWIAACALESGAPLVSGDLHFKEIDDLQIETW